MQHKYIIEGAYPIKGKIKVNGNKNAALPCIAACLLSDEETILRNIPQIKDVEVMFEILREIGCTVKKLQNNSWSIKVNNLDNSKLMVEKVAKIRASVLFIGPLLARCGEVKLALPGGDIIGKRRLDTHFLAMEALGSQTFINGHLSFRASKLVGASIFLDEASVTATENAIMAGTLAEGITELHNAASEPHVQDLCNMLVLMGARISGIGSNILRIEGVKKLHGCDFRIGADFMETGSLIGLAAVTHGELELTDVDPQYLRMCRLAFAKLGIHWEQSANTIFVSSTQKMHIKYDIDGSIPTIDDGPWPSFPADLTSIIAVIATQATGTILIHEKMFESRLFFVDKLIGMGARIILCDPHRAVVSGPSRLLGDKLSSPDVRAGMAMLIAALCAQGESIIHNVYQIERGYEDIGNRLKNLGAHILRVKEDY